VQECERKRFLEVTHARAEQAADRQFADAALQECERRRSRTLDEAQRRIAEHEQSIGEWKALKELELSKREAGLETWAAAKREHRAAAEDHHKEMLALERGMHRKTMERTLDRVALHLTCGGGASPTGGRETPTREVIAAAHLDAGPLASPARVQAPDTDTSSEFDSLIKAVLCQHVEFIATYKGDLEERGQYAREEEWPVALPPGYTALGVAAAFGKRKSAEALLQAGADPRGLDESGAYPQAIALAANQPEIAELIRTWPSLPPAIKRTWPAPGRLLQPLDGEFVDKTARAMPGFSMARA